MSNIDSSRSMRWFVLLVTLPALALLTVSVWRTCVGARQRATDDLSRYVEVRATELEMRVERMRDQFDVYTELGFARLSTDAIVGRPGFGIVDARLRRARSVAPLDAAFTRISIAGESGVMHWLADRRRDDGEGGMQFSRVRSIDAPVQIDTAGFALLLAGMGTTEVERVGEQLCIRRAFGTDPYDARFVITGELPIAAVTEGLVAGVTPPWNASVNVRTTASEATLSASTIVPQHAAVVLPLDRLVVRAAGAWPTEVWTVASAERYGVRVEASLEMQPIYRRMLVGQGAAVAAVVWALFAALVLLRRSLSARPAARPSSA